MLLVDDYAAAIVDIVGNDQIEGILQYLGYSTGKKCDMAGFDRRLRDAIQWKRREQEAMIMIEIYP
jgi:hypothetical protein